MSGEEEKSEGYKAQKEHERRGKSRGKHRKREKLLTELILILKGWSHFLFGLKVFYNLCTTYVEMDRTGFLCSHSIKNATVYFKSFESESCGK